MSSSPEDEYCEFGCMPIDHGEEPDMEYIISIDPSDTGATGVYVHQHQHSELTAGPPSYPPPGIYNKMISRNTDGSDPLVPEPGP
jgi:hypothetical protein